MSINRRDLLKLFGLAAVDPERLIWEPGRKIFSLPTIVQPKILLGGARDGLRASNTLWAQSEFVREVFCPRWHVNLVEMDAAIKAGRLLISARDYRIPFSVSVGFKVRPRENG